MFPTLGEQALVARDNPEKDQSGKLGPEVSSQFDGQLAYHDTAVAGLYLRVESRVEAHVGRQSSHVAEAVDDLI